MVHLSRHFHEYQRVSPPSGRVPSAWIMKAIGEGRTAASPPQDERPNKARPAAVQPYQTSHSAHRAGSWLTSAPKANAVFPEIRISTTLKPAAFSMLSCRSHRAGAGCLGDKVTRGSAREEGLSWRSSPARLHIWRRMFLTLRRPVPSSAARRVIPISDLLPRVSRACRSTVRLGLCPGMSLVSFRSCPRAIRGSPCSWHDRIRRIPVVSAGCHIRLALAAAG